MKECICFAYYGDGKFLGWYSDSFGTISKNSPKIYSNKEKQIDIVLHNAQFKIKNKPKTARLEEINPVAEKIIANSLKQDNSIFSPYNEIELRIVSCPFYDGPNPDFNKEEYKKMYDLWYSTDRSTPRPTPNSWITPDWEKFKEWANNEPTEFLQKFKLTK